MKINNKIVSNLEMLFEDNYKEIKHPYLSQWLDLLKTDNPDVYYPEEKKIDKFYDKESLNKFEKAKKNKKLIELYETVIEFSLNETEIINKLSLNLKSSFEKIKKERKDIEDSKIQIIILAHYNEEPDAWFSGYGEGNYPILEKPEYFDFNYQKTFFENVGNIDYSCIWSNLSKLEECLKEADIYDEVVFHSDFYQKIRNSYIFKTYLLLNKAFNKNKKELFNDLNMKEPLFIYGEQFGAERINIYSYE